MPERNTAGAEGLRQRRSESEVIQQVRVDHLASDQRLSGAGERRAIRAALNGATVAKLDAIFGWQGGGMAALYAVKLTARVSPSPPCRDLARKEKRYQMLGNQVVGEGEVVVG